MNADNTEGKSKTTTGNRGCMQINANLSKGREKEHETADERRYTQIE
jgi:hypothetical protein